MINEVEALVDMAVLGKQVEIFLDSRVGKYMLTRIRREEEGAIEALKTADPHNPVLISKWQNAIYRADSIKLWLEEAIIAGLKATEVLEERDNGNEY